MATERYFVTGGGGFIGSHVVRALGHGDAPVEIFEGDIRDETALRNALRTFEPTVVFHLAAKRSKEKDLTGDLFDTNTLGTRNLVHKLSQSPFRETRPRLVAIGTTDECIGTDETPVTETTREAPVSPYALTKLLGTKIVEHATAEHGLRAVVLRASIVYGAGQTPDMFIPACITTLLSGKTFEMSSGEQERDFVYIDDLVSALMRAGEQREVTGVVHIVGGTTMKVKDVAEMIHRLVGKGFLSLGTLPVRDGERMVHALSRNKAQEVLGWEPRVSLEDGLQKTVAWYATYRGA